MLDAAPVRWGSRWIYSAGFNVAPGATAMERVDEELADLRRLVNRGASVAVLANQGDGPETARHLDHVAAYLGRALGRFVRYVPTSVGAAAMTAAAAMAPGDIVLFGNTRFYAGEQRNDPRLAAEFARLGERVAVGGFSKAHRRHASNVGVLAHRPGYATAGLAREIGRLAPWAGGCDGRFSVAVLGGVKPEKVCLGLAHQVDHHDMVIPGGAVLNVVLAALGKPVGRSVLTSTPERCVAVAREVLRRTHRARLHIPAEVVVAPVSGGAQARTVRVGAPVADREAIVDFVLRPWARAGLARLAREPSRALLAGTPARYDQGHRGATDEILRAFAAPAARSLLLGGDTAAELPWDGPASTGGGSALALLGTGTCEVIEALRASAHRIGAEPVGRRVQVRIAGI